LDSERKVEVSIGVIVLNVCTEGIVVCWAFGNVKLHWELSLLGRSKLEILTIFRDVT